MYPAFVLVTRIVTPEVNSSFTKKHHSSSHSWPSFYSSTIDLYLCIHWFILSDMFYYYSIQNIPKPLCNHAATWQQYQISAPISAPQYIHIHINMYECIYVTSYIPSSLMPGCKTLSRMKSPDVWRLRAEFSWRKRCTSSASNTMLLTSSNPNIQEYLLIFLEHFTSINAQHPSTDCSTPFNRVSCITFNRGLVFCGLNVWKGLLNQIENVPHQQILW